MKLFCKHILFIGFLVYILGLVACKDNYPRDSKGRLNDTPPAEVCRNGVVYYRDAISSTHSYTPKFLPNSKVETCQ